MEAIGGAGLSTHAKAALKRMARHKRCSVAVLVENGWRESSRARLSSATTRANRRIVTNERGYHE
jgi:hypothetical protein